MNTIGTLLYRSTVILCVVALALALPASTASAAYPSEDFNKCAIPTGWVAENGVHAAPTITGQNSENAALTLVVAPGVQSTMSGSAQNATRVMRPQNDESFELEVRFNSALGLTPSAGNFKMQGVLVRDDSGSSPQWLRFDFNTDHDSINFYITYLNESGVETRLSPGSGVAQINAEDAAAVGTIMRIKYTQTPTGGSWAFRYWLPVRGWSNYEAMTFDEALLNDNFVVSAIGLWAGSTGPTPPGHTAQFDYFWNGPVDESVEDAVFVCEADLTEHVFLPAINR